MDSALGELLNRLVFEAREQRSQSNWVLEREALHAALNVALHIISPNDYPLPESMGRCDWSVFGWNAESGTVMTKVLENCTRDEAWAQIRGSSQWLAVTPLATIKD